MAVTRDLLVQIQADTKAASDNVKGLGQEFAKFSDSAQKTGKSVDQMQAAVNRAEGTLASLEGQGKGTTEAVGKIEAALSSFGVKAALAATIVEGSAVAFEALKAAVELVAEPIKKSLEEFDAYRSSLGRLQLSLASSGSYSKNAVEGFKAFADELERTSNVQEETTFKLVALAKNFGLTDDAARKAAKTAADVAAGSGESIESVFSAILTSFKGVTRGVAEFDRGLIGMDQTLARNGGALDKLSVKYAGFAESLAKGFGGTNQAISNTINQILKEIGGAIDEIFDRTGAAKTKLAFLEGLLEQVKAVKPAVIDFAETVKTYFKAVAETLSKVDWKSLKDELLPVLGGIALALGTIQAIKLAPLAIDLAAMAVSGGLAAAQFVIIGSSVAAVGLAIDVLLKNMDKLDAVGTVISAPFVLAFKNIELLIRGLETSFQEMLQNFAAYVDKFIPGIAEKFAKFLEPFSSSNNKKLIETQDEIDQLADRTDKAFKSMDKGIAGAVIGSVSKAISDWKGVLKQVTDASKKVEKPGPTNRPQSAFVSPISEENKKTLDEIISKGREAQKQAADAGKSAFVIAQQDADQQQNSIKNLQAKLTAEGQITDKIKQQLQLASEEADAGAAAKQAQIIKETTERTNEVLKANGAQIASFGKTQEEQNDIQLAFILDQIEHQKYLNTIALAGKDDELAKANDLLDIAKEQEKIKHSQAQSVTPSKDYEAPLKAGQQLAQTITTGAGGIASSALGIAGAANFILDAVKGIIDLIPSILGKVGDVFNMLTDLPQKLVEGVSHINEALLNFTKNFIPMIMKASTQILESGIQFFQKLPSVFQNLIKGLPDMINKFVDALPDLIQRTMEATVSALPEMIGSLIYMIVSKLPQIIIKLMESLVIKMPIAFVKGIFDAVKNIGSMIGGQLKNVTKIDTSGIAKGFKAITKDLGTQSSKLFSVVDANAKSRGVDAAKKIEEAISGSTNRAKNILQNLWNGLRDLWGSIWDQILKPFLNMLQGAWNAVYQNVIQPLLTGLQAVWNFVYSNVIQPISSIVMSAFTWVIDHVLTPISTVVQSAFNWVVVNIFNPLSHIVGEAFSGVKSLFDNLSGTVSGAFSFVKNIFDNFTHMPSWLSSLVDTVRSMASNFSFVTDFGTYINKLSGSFSFITDFGRIIRDLQGSFSFVTDLTNTVNKLAGIGNIGGGSGGGFLGSIGIKLAEGGLIGAQHYYAAGGIDVSKLARGNDRIPIMAAADEFVMRGRATRAIGTDALNFMNQTGRMPGGSGSTVVSVGGITINSSGKDLDQTFIRQTLVPALMKEIKRASVDNKFVMSSKGLRTV